MVVPRVSICYIGSTPLQSKLILPLHIIVLQETARHMIPKALAHLTIPTTTEVVVRVNGVASGLIREDLHVTLRDCPTSLPEALMIPKVQSAQDLIEVDLTVFELIINLLHN